jgi:hypothetical protein
VRHCLFCDTELGEGTPPAPVSGRAHAYDPGQGRLWEICPKCTRWNPVPLEFRWETLSGWEAAIRDRGTPRITGANLVLFAVDDGEVVRVGSPKMQEWGGWRYGVQLARTSPLRAHQPPRTGSLHSLVQRLRVRVGGWLGGILAPLPPPPIEGYDPYGLGGSLGGVAGTRGPHRWIGSPFMHAAYPLTLAFTSVPLAPTCPSCGGPMALEPWDFAHVRFGGRIEGGPGVLAPCALCATEVQLSLGAARPALRLGLWVLDPPSSTRPLGESAGAALDGVGGSERFLDGLEHLGASFGELSLLERVSLSIALDHGAERDALEAEWREAEEIAAIMDGELSDVEGFQQFRQRVLGEAG